MVDRTAEDIIQDRKIAVLDKALDDLRKSTNTREMEAVTKALSEQVAAIHQRLSRLEAQPWWIGVIASFFRK